MSIFFRSAAESIAQRDNLRTTEAIRDIDSGERDEVQWADSTDIGDFIKVWHASIVWEHELTNPSRLHGQMNLE